MVVCDKDGHDRRRSDSVTSINKINDEDEQNFATGDANNQNETTVNAANNDNVDTAFGDHGYTPLTDIVDNATFSTGPEGVQFSRNDGYMMFAATQQEEWSSDDNDDDEAQNDAAGGDLGRPRQDIMPDDNDDTMIRIDYAQAALSALRLLEADYAATVSQGILASNDVSLLRNEDAVIVDNDTPITNDDGIEANAVSADDLAFVADFNSNWNDDHKNAAVFPADHATLVSSSTALAIDPVAVQRAMQRMEQQNSRLRHGWEQWQHEQAQRQCRSMSRHFHHLIPAQPLAAFGPPTTKAVAASHALSRACTLAEALVRLDVLRSQGTLHIHVLGCGGGDNSNGGGEGPSTCRRTFGPLLRWMSAAPECPRHVQLHLVDGAIANVAPSSDNEHVVVDLMPTHLTRPTLQSARAYYHYGALYHEWWDARAADGAAAEEQENGAGTTTAAATTTTTTPLPPPDLMVAFNAGLWGYDSWRPTLALLHRHDVFAGVALVVTAYTLPEAEDDADVLETMLLKNGAEIPGADGQQTIRAAPTCVWEAELNPFGSHQARPTQAAAPGCVYRENAAWQAWRM